MLVLKAWTVVKELVDLQEVVPPLVSQSLEFAVVVEVHRSVVAAVAAAVGDCSADCTLVCIVCILVGRRNHMAVGNRIPAGHTAHMHCTVAHIQTAGIATPA